MRVILAAMLWVFAPLVVGSFVFGCERDLDGASFQKQAEKAYMEAHPGWGIVRRDSMTTTFVRGDQVDVLDASTMYEEYKAAGQSASAFLEAWAHDERARVEARRRSLGRAGSDVIPILKSGSWIRVQDLGAIGPRELQDKIRPWRKLISTDVFVLLGVPEERLGFRFASIDEVKTSTEGEDAWLERAIVNLSVRIGTSTGVEMRGSSDRLIVFDLANKDGVSGLILDKHFRTRMFDRFAREELGAAVPSRDVLIVFDPTDPVTLKPIRARTHQLYDMRNHPGFRGLLKFDRDGLSILEPANPEQKRKTPSE